MDFDINRFIEAQDADGCYDKALKELKSGRIENEWISFLFPRLANVPGLGPDDGYAFGSVYEAAVFMSDTTLRGRLYDLSRVLQYHTEVSIHWVTECKVDSERLHSSITLANLLAPCSVWMELLNGYFDGEPHAPTLEAVSGEIEAYTTEWWSEYGARFFERAYFDSFCHESNNLSAEGRYATFMDMAKRGHSVTSLARRYLFNHWDFFDYYRTSGVESTLHFSACKLWRHAYGWLERHDESWASKFSDDFPYSSLTRDRNSTWETAAEEYDRLIAYILSDPHLADFALFRINDYSTLRASY